MASGIKGNRFGALQLSELVSNILLTQYNGE